jgi:hypothetical protein
MKTYVYVLITVFLFFMSVSAAYAASDKDSHEFGLGIVLGEPSGINGQFYWGPKTAIDVTAAWSFHDWLMVAGDFQVYNYILDSPREWKWYYGIGTYLALPKNDHGSFGVRIPLGLRYHIPHSVVDVWGEVDPALKLVDETAADLQGGIGVTFWLK